MASFFNHNVQNLLISNRKLRTCIHFTAVNNNPTNIAGKHNYAVILSAKRSIRCFPSATNLDRSIKSLRLLIRNRHTSAMPRYAMACSISDLARLEHCEAKSNDFSSSSWSALSGHSTRYCREGKVCITDSLSGCGSLV